MGSELCNNSESDNADNIKESTSELLEDEKINNHAGKLSDDLFNQELSRTPGNPESNDRTTKPVFQPQNINSAVKNSGQLGGSNTEGDNNLSKHISMSVSGQGRVNSNVSR
jgi:hypothetical protein